MNFAYCMGHTLSRLVARYVFSLTVHGRENIPEEGPLIIASNHASYFDPPLVGICSDRDVYYLARKTLLDVPFLGWLLPKLNVIPVDRDGTDMSALRAVIRVIKNGDAIVVFPEGTRTRDGNLQPARPGVGMIVAKTRAPVLPVRVFGSFEAFPRSGHIRIHPIDVVIGKPCQLPLDTDLPPREHYQLISEKIMEDIARLTLPPRE